MGKKMPYSSIHIETTVTPGLDDISFMHGEDANDDLAHFADAVDAEIIESVCSILGRNRERLALLPQNVSVKFEVYSDEFELVLYPREDIQDCSECDALAYTAIYKHKGKIGELNPGMSYRP